MHMTENKENIFDGLRGAYRSVGKIWKTYWNVYGGFSALLCSPYFHFALLVSVVTCPVLKCAEIKWYDLSLSILPNVLGFTVGAYAILLAFGETAFRSLLMDVRKSGEGPSAFMFVSAAFVHFIFLQVLGVIYAIICKIYSINFILISFIGVLIFIYSLSSIMAATMQIFRLTEWYEMKVQKDKDKNSGSHSAN